MAGSSVVASKGVLNPKAAEKKFHISRHSPSSDLQPFIQHYWTVRWDLTNQPPYRQEVLVYPCVNMVIERGRTLIAGVATGKSSRTLEGAGQVFGIMFKPGGFYPFIKSPVSDFANSALPFEAVFGVESAALEATVLSLDDDGAMIHAVEAFFHDHLPQPDANLALINEVVSVIIANRSITKVDDLLPHISLSKRTLQRLFSQYVGVSPKWVIQRYRLHEAAAQLTTNETVTLARLAAELGYFDQAHFIKDFKTIIGVTPAEYTKQVDYA